MPETKVRGVVEGANYNGIKIDGRWYNYSHGFAGAKPSRDSILGRSVELDVVGAERWIKAVTVQESAAAPTTGSGAPVPESVATDEPAPSPVPSGNGAKLITANQASKVQELADNREIPLERLNQAVKSITGKFVAELSVGEASGLLQMLGLKSRPPRSYARR